MVGVLSMKRAELRRRIMSHGFISHGFGSRHEVFVKNDVQVVIPTGRGDVKPKTYHNIMKAVEMANKKGLDERVLQNVIQEALK